MRRRYSLLCLQLLLAICQVNAISHFSLTKKEGSLSTLPIAISVNSDYSFNPFSDNTIIRGLSIDGRFTRNNNDYLIRILLKDKRGKEYLIMESYKEIYSESSHSFENYGEETLDMNNIYPDSIKIFVSGCHLELTAIHILKSTATSLSIARQVKSEAVSRKEEQVKEIVEKINAYNKVHNRLWRAGVTELSLKSYEDKKRILALEDGESTGGFEYYADGIFEIGDVENQMTKKSASAATSSFVDYFDWRNQHGKNWITPNKD